MFFKVIYFKNTASYFASNALIKKINELKVNLNSKYLKLNKDFS